MRILRTCFLIVLLVSLFGCEREDNVDRAQIEIGGLVTGRLIVGDDTDVIVTQSISFPVDAGDSTFILGDNVRFLIGEGMSIELPEGTVFPSIGNVTFMPDGNANWGRLVCIDDTLSMRNALVIDAQVGLLVENCSLMLENCQFQGCGAYAVLVDGADSVVVQDCSVLDTNGFAFHSVNSNLRIERLMVDTAEDGMYFENSHIYMRDSIIRNIVRTAYDEFGPAMNSNIQYCLMERCNRSYSSYSSQPVEFKHNILKDFIEYGIYIRQAYSNWAKVYTNNNITLSNDNWGGFVRYQDGRALSFSDNYWGVLDTTYIQDHITDARDDDTFTGFINLSTIALSPFINAGPRN